MKHLIPMHSGRCKNGDLVGERYILGQDKYQVELLTNLDQLPTRGAIIYAISLNQKMHLGSLLEHLQLNHQMTNITQ